MRHRRQGYYPLQAHGLGKGEEPPANAPAPEYGHLIFYFLPTTYMSLVTLDIDEWWRAIRLRQLTFLSNNPTKHSSLKLYAKFDENLWYNINKKLSWCLLTLATRLEVSQGHQTWYNFRYSNFFPKMFDFKKCLDLEIRFRGHSRSSEPTQIDPSPMTSY